MDFLCTVIIYGIVRLITALFDIKESEQDDSEFYTGLVIGSELNDITVPDDAFTSALTKCHKSDPDPDMDYNWD